jgi:hypothetical protein
MQIPRSTVDAMTAMVNAISADAQGRLAELLESVDWTADVATVREQLIQAMEAVCGVATDEAAIVATEMYDGIRALELGQRLDAAPMSGRDPAATEGAVRAFVDGLVRGKGADAIARMLASRVDYETKVAATQAALECAKRDRRPPRFARVPSGVETCDFCLMLASRGFVYHTEAAAGHSHANCDCRVLPSWKAKSVEGYDPGALYDQWQASIDAKAAERAERNGTTEAEERARIMRRYRESASRGKRAGRSYAPTQRPDLSKTKNYVTDENAKKQARALGSKMRAEAKDRDSAMGAIVRFDAAWQRNAHSVDADNRWAERVSRLMADYGITLADLAEYRASKGADAS